jgi:hypothetical protein
MSGNGRGSDTNGGPTNGHTCPALFAGAKLASPKGAVIANLKTGDILDLRVIQQGSTYILIASTGGADAGSVTHTSITQIIKCIQEGNNYVGHITKLEGGNLELDIRLLSQ